MAENRARHRWLAVALGTATMLAAPAVAAQTPPPLTPATPSGPGLTPAPPAPPISPAPTVVPTAPIEAPPVVRIGIIAGENGAYRLRQVEPFRRYLETATGARVEIIALRDFEALIDSQIEGLVQYAVYSASAFVTAEALCSCVEPIAAPADSDGALGFYSVLLSRADGPITSLAEARGARLALVAGDSVAGRLIPLDALALGGVAPAEYFSSVVDVASPAAAVVALLAGEVDIAVAWSSLTGDPVTGYTRGVLTQMLGAGALSVDQLRVVWRSELIPYGPHAIRTDMPPALKAVLGAALTGASATDPAAVDAIEQGGAAGFVTPDPALYDPLRRLVAVAEASVAPTPAVPAP